MNRICVLPVPRRAQGELVLGNVSSSCLFWSSCEVRERVTVLVLCELWAPYCGTFMEMQNSTVTCSWLDVAWC